MDSTSITIETSLTPIELNERLRGITITDFSQIQTSKNAAYYGEVNMYSFDFMDVKYGPMSSLPSIQGEISEDKGKTIVSIKMDIFSHYNLSRKMYYSILLPISLIVLLISFLVLGGTEYQLHGFIFSGSFITCALLVVYLTKLMLLNTKKREIKSLALRINGKIISEN